MHTQPGGNNGSSRRCAVIHEFEGPKGGWANVLLIVAYVFPASSTHHVAAFIVVGDRSLHIGLQVRYYTLII